MTVPSPPSHTQGSILYYARQIAEEQAGGPVTDAVITVPAYFGQRQRQVGRRAGSQAERGVGGRKDSAWWTALQPAGAFGGAGRGPGVLELCYI